MFYDATPTCKCVRPVQDHSESGWYRTEPPTEEEFLPQQTSTLLG